MKKKARKPNPQQVPTVLYVSGSQMITTHKVNPALASVVSSTQPECENSSGHILGKTESVEREFNRTLNMASENSSGHELRKTELVKREFDRTIRKAGENSSGQTQRN
ncbi:hypothetical protein AJ79_07055 [Helicocarpus griseus UAMH5409]|uniref:Uncharacterized protein n=1 Tax=Helicocarpus griseus UAMH5409 TaxID=1447875 RepID=A0A2B7X6J8_9EURO|nr:hypothetical protein AJ79_07055 [Helicocarpus griseus UAMH5409]